MRRFTSIWGVGLGRIGNALFAPVGSCLWFGWRGKGWGVGLGMHCLHQCVRGCGWDGGVRVMIFFHGSEWVLAKLVNNVFVWSILIIDWARSSYYRLYLMGHNPLHTY